MTTILEVQDLTVRYDMIEAVRGVSLHLQAGEVVAVLGANGAGKSSMLSAISGNSDGTVGGIVKALDAVVPQRSIRRLVRNGLAIVPEGRQILGALTVDENLRLGAYLRRGRRANNATKAHVYEMFPILAERHRELGGLLSGGEQQMLAFGRALMARPKLILMDEPSMGLAPIMVDFVMESIRRINAEGVTVLLVEQNATASLGIASRAYVMDNGQIVRSGSSEELRNDPGIIQTYLGLQH